MNTEPIFQTPENILDLHVSISKGNVKLGYIPSFSTVPSDEILCDADGCPLTNVVGTCKGVCGECKHDCYAVRMARGLFRSRCMPAWIKNTILLRNYPQRVIDDITAFCVRKRSFQDVFRINTAGEVENVSQWLMWFKIAEDCPRTRFYIYTKSTAVLSRAAEIAGGKIPENLTVNVSQWNNTVQNPLGLQEFVYDDGTDPEVAKLPHCPAVNKDGHETGVQCRQCQRCTRRCDGQKTAVYSH